MPKPLRVYAEAPSSKLLRLGEESSHYITHVHRLKPGAKLLLFDPALAVEADATLVELGKQVRVEVGEPRAGSRLGLAGLHLLMARPKPAAFEEALRGAVALGVGRVSVFEGAHSLRVKQGHRFKAERYSAIASDTARQCLRSDLPVISDLGSLSEAMDSVSNAAHCVLHPEEAALSLPQSIERAQASLDALPGLALWLGPEGGFSQEEIRFFAAQGACITGLGPLVLRVSVAVTAALGFITARWWDRQQPPAPTI